MTTGEYMPSLISSLVNAFLLLLIIISTSYAYNTESTRSVDEPKVGGHEKMADWSVKLFQQESFNFIDFTPLRTGTRDEDSGNSPLRHFYNPTNGKGLYNFESAKSRAKSWYEKAVKSKSFYELGHALHLVQDMAAPSHAHSADHSWQSQIGKKGYEWWITRNWDGKIEPFLRWLNQEDLNSSSRYNAWLHNEQQNFKLSRAADIDAYIEIMSNATYAAGYDFDDVNPHYISIESTGQFNRNTVTDSESEYDSIFLIPSAIRLGAGLLKSFCFDIGCLGPPTPAPNNTRTPGHPDDNFDVSSRLIELEELDVTKQAWKDLYGRTGIKKRYNGLFL